MARTFSPSEYIGSLEASIRAPEGSSPAIGCALVEAGTNQLGWTASPVALDSAVVHKTGNETVAGNKTFSDTVVVPTGYTSGGRLKFGSDVGISGRSGIMDFWVGSASPLTLDSTGIYTGQITATGNITTSGVVKTVYLQTINPSAQTLTAVAYGYSFRMGGTEVPRVVIDPIKGLGVGVNSSGMSAGVWLKDNGSALSFKTDAGADSPITASTVTASQQILNHDGVTDAVSMVSGRRSGSSTEWWSIKQRALGSGFGWGISINTRDGRDPIMLHADSAFASSGRVGIAMTTLPQWTLDVAGTVNATAYRLGGQQAITSTAAGTGLGSSPTISTSDNRDFVLLQPSGGNVGIGTNNPSSFAGGGLTLGKTSAGKNLIVYSSADGANGVIQFIDKNNADALQIAADSTQVAFYGYGSRPMKFFTNGVEHLRIESTADATFRRYIQQGFNSITPSFRSVMDGVGQRRNQVGNGSGAWQDGFREEYNAGGYRCATFGKTPIAQQTAPSVATDLASAITAVNTHTTSLTSFGLYA